MSISEVIDEIKERLSIEDALYKYGGVKLTKKHRYNYKSYNIKCPLHDDRSPSFTIWSRTKSWKCHAGCGSGDVINLVGLLQGISNRDARIMLQKQLGIKDKWTANDYALWQDDKNILRGLEETKNEIIAELKHFKSVFNHAMKLVSSIEDRDRIYEVYHLKSMMDKYLEDLNSRSIKSQAATIRYLKYFLKYLQPSLKEVQEWIVMKLKK